MTVTYSLKGIDRRGSLMCVQKIKEHKSLPCIRDAT